MRFRGRAAIVTGATGEIGKVVALELAREGCALALCGRRVEALESLRRACLELTQGVIALPFDVRDEAAMANAFDCASSLGPIEAVVGCHGINRVARLDTIEADVWNEVITTNLTGCFLLVREAVRRMRPARRGQIVLISSVSGRPGYLKYPGFGAYSSSKYALTGLSEVVTAELEDSGVRLSILCPAGVATGMFLRTVPGGAATLSRERVAAAVVDLADPITAPPCGTIVDLL